MTADNSNSKKMKRKEYEKQLQKLQVELCRLQDWVKAEGAKIIIVFEGRDAAGKGGTIKAITERVSPRVFRVVALPAPSDREKSQMYIQRYIAHYPAAGEIVIFDRSWYNRAGVEYVMGVYRRTSAQTFFGSLPHGRTLHCRRWDHINKNMARGRPRRTRKAVQRPHQRSFATMEAKSDGRGILSALVCLFAGARLDARSDGYEVRPLVHRAHRQQAAGKAQLYFTHPCSNTLQENYQR